MTLSEFRYIVAVAKELHFGRAAEKCFVSQPTLSVAVKKIEDELGVALFERHQHEISVTPIGEAIVKQAELILNETNNLKEIAKQNKDELKGELKLGVIYTVGPYLLPKLIPVINKQAPDLILIIEEDFTKNLAPKLKSGEIDVAILSSPFEESGIVTELLYTEPFQVALPSDHPLTKKKKLKANDLLNDTMLLLKSGNCFRDQIVELCPNCLNPMGDDKKIQKSLESSSLETIRQMVAAGVGITILPALSIETNSGLKGMLEYRPFSNPVPSREIVIAYRKSFPRKKAIDLIKKSIASCNIETV
jgi:LysR family transcriptional regulator, hydrogen peroxide-inducible genes activator